MNAIYKNFAGILAFTATLICAQQVLAQESGKEIFQQQCAACHSIGGGRLVGPDLAGVNDRHTEEWLLKFVKSAQAVINSGDLKAKALFDEFKMIMPDQALSNDQIKGILVYIKKIGGEPAASAKPTTDEMPEPTQDEIELGRNLFQGKIRFANNGPSCNSCHHVKNDAVIGGGILAKELTSVFSRMGGEGVRAILGGVPFPVMQAAYKGKEFTPEEIRALLGFFQYADKERFFQQPKDYGWQLFYTGAGGVFVLIGLYWVIGRRRKKRSVNQDIYDRQIKSE